MPITRQVWSRAGAIVANSQGLHDLAQKTLPGRRIEIVPNGVDLDTFCPAGKGKDDPKKVRLLFVGRLAGQKGLPYLLQALSRLSPDVQNNTELEIVGSGPDESALKAMTSELKLNGVVKFSGWVPRETIPAHYQEADVFVLPSLDEGLPNVVLEAMGCGNAIVATDIRGNQELVSDGENGLLVPAADSESLAVALEQIIANRKLREQMGRNSRAKVMRYSWASTADRYLDISASIVALSNRQYRNPKLHKSSSKAEPYTEGGPQH
jgi:glycosyltransferase involved in cell wall biosynthesis